MYKITLLKTAHIKCADSVIYKDGNKDTTTTIGCHAFLLEKDGKRYLIDTGIEDIDIVNKTKSSVDDWARSADEYSIEDNLKRLGVDCGSIEKVFVTHAHYDHISGLVHFPNADVYMTRTEYEVLYSEDNNLKEFLADVKEFLKDKKVVLFDDELVVEDIKLVRRGGHTPGSMSVEVDGILFSGDTIFVQDNIKKGIPAGFTLDRQTSDELLKLYKEYEGKIITSHDIGEEV